MGLMAYMSEIPKKEIMIDVTNDIFLIRIHEKENLIDVVDGPFVIVVSKKGNFDECGG